MNWFFITRLGGVNVTLPAAIGIFSWLCAARAWRLVWWWCALLCSLLTLTVASKILFIGWGLGIPALDFTGISGHALRATFIFPVLSYLVVRSAAPSWRIASVLTGLALGALIGLSRVKLHAHSVSEVVVGCLLGGAAGAMFLHLFEQPRNFVLDRAVVVFSFIGLIAATFLTPAPTQHWMISSALYISGHDRPYVRHGWKLAPPDWHRHAPAPGNLSGKAPPRQ